MAALPLEASRLHLDGHHAPAKRAREERVGTDVGTNVEHDALIGPACNHVRKRGDRERLYGHEMIASSPLQLCESWCELQLLPPIEDGPQRAQLQARRARNHRAIK